MACPRRSRWAAGWLPGFLASTGGWGEYKGRAWPEPVAKQRSPRSGSYSYAVMDACEGAFFNHDPRCRCCSMAPSLCCASLSGHCSRPRRESRSPARRPLSGGRCLPWEKMKSNGGHRKERKKATKGELAAAGQKAVGGERDGWRFYLE